MKAVELASIVMALVPLALDIKPVLPLPQSMSSDPVMVSVVVENVPLLRHTIVLLTTEARWKVAHGEAWVQVFESLPVADT